MPSTDATFHLLQAHGLLLLFPLAILEGPIVTVLGAYAARLGFFGLVPVYVVVILGDLVGDGICYAVGRVSHGSIPARWRSRLGLDEVRQAKLVEHFRDNGGRTLIMGKLTHSAGMLVLLAAGAARMRFLPFLLYNLVGTIPKSLFFVVIGYTLGAAYKRIDSHIFGASIVILVLGLILGLGWLWHRRRSA